MKTVTLKESPGSTADTTWLSCPITPAGFWIITLIFACAAALLVNYATFRYGVGLSPDSTGYIHLARDMVENGGRFLFEQQAVDQPPVYPAFLALVALLTGGDPLIIARIVNLVVLPALIILIMLSVRRVSSFPATLVVVGALSCFSIPLMQVFSMAWSEPLFILIVTAVLYEVASRPTAFTRVCLIALLTSLACLTRYAGVILIPLVALGLWYSFPPKGNRRWIAICGYLIITAISVGGYVLRNYIVSGTCFGDRAPSRAGLAYNTYLAAGTYLNWIWPVNGPSKIVTLVTVCLCLAFVWFYRHRLTGMLIGSHWFVLIYGGFCLCYTAFIVWSSSTTAYDFIDERLLSPTYPALMVMLAIVMTPDSWGGGRRAYIWVCILGLCCTHLAVWVVKDVNNKSGQGAGAYNNEMWRESALIKYFRINGQPRDGQVFSNDLGALYILANVKAKQSPAARYYHSDKSLGLSRTNLFVKYPDLDGVLLVWFDKRKKDYLYSPEELEGLCSVQRMTNFADGSIYRIKEIDSVK